MITTALEAWFDVGDRSDSSRRSEMPSDGPSTGLRSDNPQAYIPGDRRRALAQGRELADRVHGSVLFADISGFTPLTETLAAELGAQRGAEELTAALDAVIAPLLSVLDRHGGDVIYFSGDAVTAWIDGDDGAQAVACALAMQELMGRIGERVTPKGRTLRLGLKVAVAVGGARRFVVGLDSLQLIDVLAGALMDKLAEAEHAAKQGDVVVDEGALAAVGDRLILRERRGRAAVVDSLADPPPLPPLRPDLPELPEEEVRKWLLPAVFERMNAGHGEFLAEIRPGVPLFLRFGGIDYDDDPDAIAKLDQLVRSAQLIVDAHGGNVMQLTIGDKGAYLYAVFGAPVAHQDDAARACASALELVRLGASTTATGIQIGVASGRLRSGTYGHPDRRTFCCLGDAVNLAARLMSAAPAGGIYVSAEVRRAAGLDFDWQDSTTLRVAGKSAEVIASPLVGRRRTTQDVPAASTDLIGRQAELSELRNLATEVIAGRGRIAVITGDGGVGKSRLLAELHRWLLDRGARVRTAAGLSYGAHRSYGVWQDIVRDAWDLDAEASADVVTAKLEQVLGDIGEQLLPRLPLLGPLLDLNLPDTALTASFDAKLRKTSLESLMVDVLTASTARGPLAYLIDSAEHVDDLSWDLFETIGRAVPRMPLLIVVSRRPGGGADSAPLAALPQVRRMNIEALDETESRALIQSRLQAHSSAELPRAALDRLTALAAGNPFHLEELVNYLVDQGIDPARAAQSDVGLPTSLHSLELARIDALAEAPRRTLKVASVVGARFDRPTVVGSYPDLGNDAEVGDYLLALSAASLVVDDGAPGAHAFRNVTTRQVAYETLPFATRTSLHDRVLEWLEAHASSTNESTLDLFAYHASNGTDEAKTRDYLVRAGEAAQARYANDAAVDYFSRALPLVDPDARAGLLVRLGKGYEIVGRWADAEQAYGQAIALREESGDRHGWANAQTDLAEVARKQGRFDDARHLLLDADAVYAELDGQVGRGNVLHLMGTLASQQGQYDQARAAYEASLQIRTKLDDQAKIGGLFSNLAIVAEQLGEYDTARTLNERALAVREGIGDPWATAVSRNNLGMIALLQEDFVGAAAHVDESMRLAGEVGDRWLVAVGQHNNGIARRGLGRYRESGTAFVEVLQAYLDHDDRWSLTLLAEDVVFLAVDTGQDAEALQLLGAADAFRAELEAPRSPAAAALLEAAVAPARDRVEAVPVVLDSSDVSVPNDLATLVRAVARAAADNDNS